MPLPNLGSASARAASARALDEAKHSVSKSDQRGDRGPDGTLRADVPIDSDPDGGKSEGGPCEFNAQARYLHPSPRVRGRPRRMGFSVRVTRQRGSAILFGHGSHQGFGFATSICRSSVTATWLATRGSDGSPHPHPQFCQNGGSAISRGSSPFHACNGIPSTGANVARLARLGGLIWYPGMFFAPKCSF